MTNMRDFAIGVHPLLEEVLEQEERRSHNRPHLKSTLRASQVLSLGQAMFRAQRFSDALQRFSECIANAPPDSELLALGFAERSKSLLLIKKYDLALLDLNRALQGPLPEADRDAALKKRNKCWQKLQKERSGQIFTSSQFEDFKYPLNQDIDQTDFLSDDLPVHDDPIWNTQFNNPLLENVSKKVKVEYNEEFGRHLIATENIEPGEVLSNHQIFGAITNRENEYNFCGYCFIWCDALIPCRTCNKEMYCSQRCLKLAYDSYHRTECKILGLYCNPLSWDEAKTKMFFPLRWFLIGTDQGAKLTEFMSDPKILECLQGKSKCVDVKYSLTDYYSILDLPWKDAIIAENKQGFGDASGPKSTSDSSNNVDEDGRDFGNTSSKVLEVLARPLHKLPMLTVNAEPYLRHFMKIFVALKSIHFFCEQGKEESHPAGILTDKEIFACMLLLQHVLAMRRNVGFHMMALFENIMWAPVVGKGAGGLLSLMNHACDANVSSVASKRWILSYCLKPIKAGQQIFTEYPLCAYRKIDLNRRRPYIINTFLFECRCAACVEDWPTYENILKKVDKMNFIITKIDKIFEITDLFVKQQNMVRLNIQAQEQDDERLKETLKLRKTMSGYVKDPSIMLYTIDRNIYTRMYAKGNSYRTGSLNISVSYFLHR